MTWIAFKLDFLQVTQRPRYVNARDAFTPIPLDFAICYPDERLAYLTPTLPGPTEKQPNRKPTAKQIADHAATGLCTGDSPPHASAIIFLPEANNVADSVARFKHAFSGIGAIVFDADRYANAAAYRIV